MDNQSQNKNTAEKPEQGNAGNDLQGIKPIDKSTETANEKRKHFSHSNHLHQQNGQ